MRVFRHDIDATDPDLLNDKLAALEQYQASSFCVAFGSYDTIQALSECETASRFCKSWVATSSCLNAFSDLAPTGGQHLAILQFVEVKGTFGIASRQSHVGSITQDTKAALTEALQSARKPGELPALIWCSTSPGLEEGMLRGIRDTIGDNIPVFGGSCADNNVSGNWCMFDGKQLINCGFVIAVLFPSVPVSYYFSCGYEATANSATVTAACERQLISLDNQPAAKVYNQWRSLSGLQALEAGPVLAQSTFSPFGRLFKYHDMDMALLSHPAQIRADGSIDLFSEINIGDKVTFMRGDNRLLIERAGTVSGIAFQQLYHLYDCLPQAAIVIFCAGCMLAIPEDIKQVHASIKHALPNTPFIGGYTFGEQGRFADGINRHGNLMISAIIFGSLNEPA